MNSKLPFFKAERPKINHRHEPFPAFLFFCIRLLSSISHLVLDEIHERNLQSDVLLIIVKDLLNLRDDIKIILMSATLNAEKFSRYFGMQHTECQTFLIGWDCSSLSFTPFPVLTPLLDNCPIIHIPGLTFPVEEFLLEDIVEMTRYNGTALKLMHTKTVMSPTCAYTNTKTQMLPIHPLLF